MGRLLLVVATGLVVAGLAALLAVGVAATTGAGLAEAADICSPLSKINADIDFGIDLGVDGEATFRAARVGDRLKAAPAETD